MAVRADDAVTGRYDALFGQQRVLDAHSAHVEEVFDLVLMGEFPALLAHLGGLDVLGRNEVVQDDVDGARVTDGIEPRLVEFVDGDRGGDVVAQDHVEFRFDQLAGFDRLQSRRGCQDLLRHCHSHSLVSLLFY